MKVRKILFSAALISAYLNNPCSASEATWNKFTQEGAKAYEGGNFGVAQGNFEQALVEAKKFGPDDLRLATSLTNLGVLFNFRGHNQKAGPLFEQAVRIKQKALGPDNYDTVAAVAKLCQFQIQNNPAKAEIMCHKIAGFADKKLREKRDVALSFETLNNFYKQHKELEESEIFVKQAETQTSRATATSYLELAVIIDGLAGACKTAKKLPPAEQLYKRALALRNGVLPKDHMALASSMENLGKLYIEEGRFHLAEPLLRRSFEITKTTLGAQKPETFAKIEGLGQCYIGLGKLNEAKSLWVETLSGYEKAYGKTNKYVMDSMLALGAICSKQGQAGQAATYYGDALKISEKVNGPRHASLSGILESYGRALERAARPADAKRMFARAREIRG